MRYASRILEMRLMKGYPHYRCYPEEVEKFIFHLFSKHIVIDQDGYAIRERMDKVEADFKTSGYDNRPYAPAILCRYLEIWKNQSIFSKT